MTAKSKAQINENPESKATDTEKRKTDSILPSLRHETEDTITRVLESWPRLG